MEPGTQSALILIWAIFWILILSVMMVHPMFRTTRVQIRRSLHRNLNHWRTVQHWMRVRMLRCRGYFRIRLGRALLWLARYLKQETSAPLWVRLPLRLLGRFVFFYLIMHLLFRQSMDGQNVAICLTVWAILDVVEKWWKRRKLRLQGTNTGDSSPVKPAQEQRAKL